MTIPYFVISRLFTWKISPIQIFVSAAHMHGCSILNSKSLISSWLHGEGWKKLAKCKINRKSTHNGYILFEAWPGKSVVFRQCWLLTINQNLSRFKKIFIQQDILTKLFGSSCMQIFQTRYSLKCVGKNILLTSNSETA